MARDLELQTRRKARVRRALRAHAHGRLRLSVFRSSKQIYAQIIDDEKGVTLASASSLEKVNRESFKTGANIDAAKIVGKLIAERAVAQGLKTVVFDRGGYMFHGRVKALAEGAREGGLEF
ncbi:MAG TPA: 50S ribosomal protein L18 [Methylocystis sp.]|nr:50S ribosomal protein L18 [Methylocystis sp.]